MKKIFTIILSLILSIFSYALDVYVEKVSDGDSFVAKYNGKKIRVRMYGVDAPELKQKHGKESKEYLENLILGKKVELKVFLRILLVLCSKRNFGYTIVVGF